MHVDESHSGPYVRRLLRDSFRQDGKVKHRTIANVSSCTPEEIQALKLALRHKGDLTTLASLRDATLHQGLSCGAVWVVYDLALRDGIAVPRQAAVQLHPPAADIGAEVSGKGPSRPA